MSIGDEQEELQVLTMRLLFEGLRMDWLVDESSQDCSNSHSQRTSAHGFGFF